MNKFSINISSIVKHQVQVQVSFRSRLGPGLGHVLVRGAESQARNQGVRELEESKEAQKRPKRRRKRKLLLWSQVVGVRESVNLRIWESDSKSMTQKVRRVSKEAK